MLLLFLHLNSKIDVIRHQRNIFSLSLSHCTCKKSLEIGCVGTSTYTVNALKLAVDQRWQNQLNILSAATAPECLVPIHSLYIHTEKWLTTGHNRMLLGEARKANFLLRQIWFESWNNKTNYYWSNWGLISFIKCNFSCSWKLMAD